MADDIFETADEMLNALKGKGTPEAATLLDISEYRPIVEKLKKHELPERYPDISSRPLNHNCLPHSSMLVRDTIQQLSSFALLSYEWIRPLAQWIGARRCLEIMAGTGALAHGLATCGVNVIATDDYSWEDRWEGLWTDVEKLDCIAAVEKYGATTDIVICCWPYKGDEPYRSLLALRAANPQALFLFIGEQNECVNADTSFFENAIPVEDAAFDAAISNYKRYAGMHDWPVLYR